MYAVLKASSVCGLGARLAASAARTRLSSGSTVRSETAALSSKRACALTCLRPRLTTLCDCVRRHSGHYREQDAADAYDMTSRP